MTSRAALAAAFLALATVWAALFAAGCNHSPAPPSGCVPPNPDAGPGSPFVLADGQDGPQFVAVDSTYVYWTNTGLADSGTGAVLRRPLDQSTGTVALVANLNLPGPLALDSANVYWTAADGTVNKIATGSTSTTPVFIAQGQPTPWGIAVNGQSVYWANGGTAAANFQDGALMTVPLSGGTPSALASSQNRPYEVVLDATNVYWTNQGVNCNGSVMMMPQTGGTPQALATRQCAAGPIAVDATNVYWVSGFPSTANIWKVPIGGGDAGVVQGGLQGAGGLVVDTKSLYWTDNSQVWKLPLTGTPATALASNQINPSGMAIDCGSIYWVDNVPNVGGLVMRIHPK